MEMRHLITFARAAEMQNFSRAARALGVTQAAISQHVAALEKELAVSLFQRTGRAVLLTEHGRTLYRYARQIVDLADEACDAISNAPRVVRGTLEIAASTVPSEWLLPKLLVEFRKQYPEVQEFVVVSDSAAAIQAVESGGVELGIVGELPRASQLCVKAIAHDELTLVVAPGHPFADVPSVRVDQLCEQPLVIREASSGSRRCVEQALAQAGVSTNDLNITMEVNSNEAIRAAVEQGLGVAFLSVNAMEREIRDGRLIPTRLENVVAQRALYCIRDPERMTAAPCRAFLGFLTEWQTKMSGKPGAAS